MADDGFDLDGLVEQLSEEVLHEKVHKKHILARQDYKLDEGKLKIDAFKDFQNIITEYVQHHGKATLGHEHSNEHAYAKALQYLDMALQQQGGWKAAYKMAKEGKMLQVVDTIAQVMQSEDAQRYKTHTIDSAVDPLDFEQHATVAKAYIDKWGKNLPGDYSTKSDKELAREYKNLLQYHENISGQIKQTLGKD